MATDKFNQKKAEAFAGKLLGAINDGALALMTSIGHRTKLFDKMRQMEAATSEQIAEAAGLKERYVREWLGAMTVGGIVESVNNGSQPKFSLPPEHAAFLTRAVGADNFGVFAQYIAVMGAVEDEIVKCFQNGGGVSYDKYKRFHEVMAEDSALSVLPALTDTILPLVPGLIERLKDGIKVLDIGCGSGRALNLMARTFPNSQFIGYDLCEEPLRTAKNEAEENDLTNISFEQKDLSTFDENGYTQFDLVTAFDAIHDQARPDKVLAGVYKALRPRGTFLMQDIAGSSHVHNNNDHPIAPFLYTISCMHCMTVSLAQDGMGLGAMWGKEKAVEMLNEAGFDSVEVKDLDHDIQNYYYVMNKN